MIVTVPGDIAVTMPEEEPTMAIVVLLLVHIPPDGELDNEILLPTHNSAPTVDPTIAVGIGLTVMVTDTEQPVGSV